MSKLESDMRGASDLSIRDGVYYFRKRIPDDLKESYGNKDEIKFSLKTKNKKQAEILAAAERHQLLKEFQAKRKIRVDIAAAVSGTPRTCTVVKSVDPAFIEYVCSTRLRATLEVDDEYRPLFGPDWRELVAPAERDRDFFPHLKKALANGDTEWIRPVLEAHLYLIGVQLDCPPSDYRTLAYRFLQTLVKEYEFMFARDEGNAVETDVVAPTQSLARASLTLQDLLISWRDATTRPPKTVEAFTRAVTRFTAFLRGKSPELVIRKDVIAYRDYLLAGSKEVDKLSVKATKGQIDFLKAIFRRAVANEQISNNPFHDIPFDKPKIESKPRIPFDPADLKKIFSTPVYSDGALNMRAGGGEASYWLPLLALYTGARLEELGQLRVIDVKEYAGLGWYIDINPQAGSVKTQSSDRHVPLHSKLVSLGFVTHVEKMRQSGSEKVFPSLKPDKHGVMTASWSKWFGRHLRALGITDRRKVFHSFRHGFKDMARAVGIPEEIQDAITGHANGSVGRSYGNQRYPIQPLFEAIEKIHFPTVDVSVRHSESSSLVRK